MKTMIAACILALASTNSAYAQIPQKTLDRVVLTCDMFKGQLRLDLGDQAASIQYYCHAAGCNGKGRIIEHTHEYFGDTFVLEMNMEYAPGPTYMIVKVKPDGSGEISNHPRASTLFNCIRD